VKTPKELAQEWLKTFPEGGDCCEVGFLAGYQAAKDQLDTAIASRDAWKEDAERYAESADYWKAQAAALQWILVKDRLPDSTPMVLANCSDGYELAYYGNYGKGQWTNTLGTEHLNVTHWMPLPKPPEDK